MKYQNCRICGKRCRGKTCRECIKAHSKLSTKCYICGATVSPKYRQSMCKKCATKQIAEKLRDKSDHPEYYICIHCGKRIPFLKHHKYKEVKYCSTTCFMLHTHISRKHTKESVLQKIEDFIKDKSKYVTVEDVCKNLHISEKVIYKHHICIKDINNKYGLFFREPKEIPVKIDKYKDLENRIIHFIKGQGAYTPITVILKHFHIDYESTWKNKFNFNIVDLNSKAGFKNIFSSYYEGICYNKLVEIFGETNIVTQKRFEGCKGEKGWALRFDFYIKNKNILIEVDGDQHYNDKHRLFKPDIPIRDNIKNEFAKANNISLHRIPVMPIDTFNDRLMHLLEGISKRK